MRPEKYRRILGTLVGLLVVCTIILVSCRPSPGPAKHRKALKFRPWLLSTTLETRPVPGPMKPQLSRAEKDRRYREHPKGWVKSHAEKSKSDPLSCVKCHTGQFCIACHGEKLPKSHQCPAWVNTHKTNALEFASACAICHTDDFCTSCHGSAKPGSHNTRWTKQHGKASISGLAECSLCHKDEYCDNCHQTP
ncbi:MAG: hypothetical protein NTU88_02680, partial [Armatimonadetes bacterium]|nr:hypothetical protein [Armatimonadota bacterium]